MVSSEPASIERELFVRRLASMELAGVDPPESFVNRLLLAARDADFAPGETLFEAGSASDRIYMIRSGVVDLVKEGENPWRFVDGAVGILDAIIGRLRSRTAVAVERTSCLSVHIDDYFAMLEDHVNFSHQVIRFQAARLHSFHRELPNKEGRFSRPANWRLVRSGARSLGMVERLIVLRQAPAFSSSSIQALVTLAAQARSEHFDSGTVLFRQGDHSNRMAVVAEGRVEIESDGKREAVRGPGELIESYAAFGHQRRLYTAKATTPVVLVSVNEGELFDRMEEHFELTRSVMGYLARKFEQINDSMAARTGSFKVAGTG